MCDFCHKHGEKGKGYLQAKNYLKRVILGLCLICSVLAATLIVEPAKTVTITFYHTSDIHEHSAPIARISQFVEDER